MKYSIHLASIHGNLGGRYDYKMLALYHPDAAECAKSLQDLGYELIERQTPVKVEDIEGDVLRSRIENNGCCGSKELIKLEAFTFTEYPVVVHLDLDFLLLKPIDVLFDVMLDESGDLSKYTKSVDLMWPNTTLPERVNAFFTRDCKLLSSIIVQRCQESFSGADKPLPVIFLSSHEYLSRNGEVRPEDISCTRRLPRS